jgi:hypothetical protein
MQLSCFHLKLVLVTILTACVLSGPSILRADTAPAAPTAPAIGGPAGPYTLIYKFVAGKTLKYGMTMDMKDQMSLAGQSQPLNMHIEMASTSNVQSVDPTTGAATEKVSMSNVNASMNGQPMPLDPAWGNIGMTMVMAPNGKVLSTAGTKSPFAAFGMGDTNPFSSTFFLPSKPVNIGDTWTSTIPMPTIGMDFIILMTLKSVDVVNGQTIAKIQSSVSSKASAPDPTAKAPLGNSSGNVTGVITTDFNIDGGFADNTQGTIVMDIKSNVPGANGQQTQMLMHANMAMQMTLLSSPAVQ